jgi:glucosamine--fructose-6-phosphate aminotransferase (isomerizing)
MANLIAKYYQGDLGLAVHRALQDVKGLFAFLVIHKDHPEEIIATASECPLSIGCSDDGHESVISSDPNTFQGPGFDIFFLQNREIAKVRKGICEIYDPSFLPTLKKKERLEIQNSLPSKEGFDHFMMKEIFEQPSTLQKTLLGRYENGVHFEEFSLPVKNFEKVWIFGCGTSAHAGRIATLFMEDFAHFPTEVEIASEARY